MIKKKNIPKTIEINHLEFKTQNINTNQFNNKKFDTQNIVFTIPNCLTTLRIIAIPFIQYFILIDRHDLACGLFVAASLTDFLDGFIARNFPNQMSYIGSIIDPLADKLLIGSLTITLAVYNMLPLVFALIFLIRDFALIIASLVIRYQTLEPPITFRKFLNVKKYSIIQVKADFISKLNTAFQLILISLTLPSILFNYVNSFILIILQYITGTTTILSSISYIYKRGSYTIIDKNNN